MCACVPFVASYRNHGVRHDTVSSMLRCSIEVLRMMSQGESVDFLLGAKYAVESL